MEQNQCITKNCKNTCEINWWLLCKKCYEKYMKKKCNKINCEDKAWEGCDRHCALHCMCSKGIAWVEESRLQAIEETKGRRTRNKIEKKLWR